MYQTGELVIYGRTGVCRVERIERREDGQEMYVLKPLYQSCDIYIPVNSKMFMRPIITKEEAEALIDRIPTVKAEVVEGKPMRELTEHYRAALTSHDCETLFELLISIYAKKRSAERAKKKFGAVDERFMKEGEDLLHGELAAALEIPVEEVPGYIRGRIGRAKERETVQV